MRTGDQGLFVVGKCCFRVKIVIPFLFSISKNIGDYFYKRERATNFFKLLPLLVSISYSPTDNSVRKYCMYVHVKSISYFADFLVRASLPINDPSVCHLGLRIISKMCLFSARSLLLYKIAYNLANTERKRTYIFYTTTAHSKGKKMSIANCYRQSH